MLKAKDFELMDFEKFVYTAYRYFKGNCIKERSVLLLHIHKAFPIPIFE